MTHRVIFLGSPEFAIPSLQSLVEDDRFDVALVVSQPDRRAGRGRKLTPPPIAEYAGARGLEVFQPTSLRYDEAVERLESVRPDVLVVVAYGEILTRRVLSLARAGALNVHPSLLPAYRGASPIPAAILNGDAETGVSIIRLVRKLDAGPVIAQTRCAIQPDDTAAALGERLAHLAAEMLPDVAHEWVMGRLDAIPQNEERATYTKEWTKEDARIDWSRPAAEIDRLVRASLPWPVAWTELSGSRLQVREVSLPQETTPAVGPPGTVTFADGQVTVPTGDGLLELVTVQPESKRQMPAAGWLRSVAVDPVVLT